MYYYVGLYTDYTRIIYGLYTGYLLIYQDCLILLSKTQEGLVKKLHFMPAFVIEGHGDENAGFTHFGVAFYGHQHFLT